MKYNLFADKKFWIALVDALIFLALYFVGKYAPIAIDDLKTVFATIQPLILLVISNMFVADVQTLNADKLVKSIRW